MTEKPIKLYRPSNGTEGDIFISAWCGNCARDKSLSEGKDIGECDDNERCDIIGNTMAYDLTDEKYPREWTYDDNNQPVCLAFIHKGDVIPMRDELTIDMFEPATQGAQS